jgi:hypothetical protein
MAGAIKTITAVVGDSSEGASKQEFTCDEQRDEESTIEDEEAPLPWDWEALADVCLLLNGMASAEGVTCICSRATIRDRELLRKGLRGQQRNHSNLGKFGENKMCIFC